MVKESDEFERRTKELFDESVERLDGRTRSKLTQARNAAIEELKKAPSRWHWLRTPMAGLVAATVLAVAVVMWPSGRSSDSGVLPLEDLDIVADADNIDMLQDVEFYAWLEDQGGGDATNHSG